jgi:hypothetical protein
MIGGGTRYSRECYVCGYEESYSLPEIRKKVVYLDQLVLSNLLKLLDNAHPRHDVLMKDAVWRARWEKIFVALERARQNQVLICPDSFTHRNESLLDVVDIRINQRMYEHYSDGKTLYRSVDVQRFQFNKRFAHWLAGTEYVPEINPDNICQGDLHEWTVGLKVTVGTRAYPGEIENLTTGRNRSQASIASLWSGWAKSKSSFIDILRLETSAIGNALLEAAHRYEERRLQAIENAQQGIAYEIDDMFPPPAVDLLNHLVRTARGHGITEGNVATALSDFFADIDTLLQIPYVKISSYMFASLARRAQLGQKKVPKSLTDVEFIASYLPYCDAMFVDKESYDILFNPPKDLPSQYRPDCYNTKLFSLSNESEFITYLDSLVDELSSEKRAVLYDISGPDREPYWDFINNTRREQD